MTKEQKHVLTAIFLYGVALLFICNYVLANGGYPTLLGISAIFSMVAIPLLLIWCGYKALAELAGRHWTKAFIYITFIAIVVVLPKILIPILAENSRDRAYQQVKEFILSKKTNKFSITFWGEKDPQLEEDFQSFCINS